MISFGVRVNYQGEIPKGFSIKTFPGSLYLKFCHPAFDYMADNGEVMRKVEEKAWSFDPASIGYEWNEGVCQDYQIHYPEVYGYEVLRPVKSIK